MGWDKGWKGVNSVEESNLAVTDGVGEWETRNKGTFRMVKLKSLLGERAMRG